MDMRKHFEEVMLKMLEKTSIDDITINHIVKEVGSCKGSFYKYYRDKYELCVKTLQNYIYSSLQNDRKDWAGFLREYLSLVDKNSKIFANAFSSVEIISPKYYNDDLIYSVVSEILKERGANIEDKVTDYILRFFARSVTDVVITFVKEKRSRTQAEVYNLIDAIMPYAIYSYVYK